MPLEAVVFDFDGVIADTEPLHLRAYQAVLAPRGLTLERADYYARYLGYDDAAMFEALARDRGLAIGSDDIGGLVIEKAERYEELIENADVLYPGAAECVRRLAEDAPLAVASGSLRQEIERILERTDLRGLFRAIVSAEDTARSKPAPDPYARAVRELGAAAARSVAIEDSRWGLESARAAGLRTVAVTHTYPARDLSSADLVIESLDSLTVGLLRRLVAQA